MSGGDQLNLGLGIASPGDALRDDGIKRAEDHAGAVAQDWPARAAQFFDAFLARMPAGETFNSLDFRIYAEANGLTSPPDNRAYGGVFLRAAKRKVIVAHGYVKIEDAKRHSAPRQLWSKA